ncbi:hypothetical protein [uncultured Ruegeria sp.]|uniref:hypothetical protein n=1 Tax=uncultured Ruegeria sp. TaxID=259304 RepID=UPI002618990D|nr:hypothetical protein [uncultured Ruegeria sp.]
MALGVLETTNLLKKTLGQPIKSVAYSAENVQLVCRFINFWKQASPDDEFRRLINLVRGL